MNGGLASDDPFRLPLRARATPVVATLVGSACAALPIVADAALLPPLGLIVALAWRLLRPELWRAWMALPLGLADDLLTGQPLGTGAALWTLVFLALDIVDSRLLFRGYWLDWVVAAVALATVIVGNWLVWNLLAGVHGATATLLLALPQLVLAVLAFPPLMWLVALLDRWRLKA